MKTRLKFLSVLIMLLVMVSCGNSKHADNENAENTSVDEPEESDNVGADEDTAAYHEGNPH